MKTAPLLFFFGSSSLLFASTLLAQASQTVTIVPEQSSLNWVGKKVTGSHDGALKLNSGEVELEDGKVTGGHFEIDMTSIKVEDIKDPGDNKKLTNHLKSDDFFSSADHPTASFEITKATPLQENNDNDSNYQLEGNLTIKGNSHPISFPARIVIGDDIATATAKVEVDRTKYNVRYGSGKFFENLGDKMIYDQFEVSMRLTGKVGA